MERVENRCYLLGLGTFLCSLWLVYLSDNGGVIMDFNEKRVLVLGLARSGVSAVKVLHRHGATVIANDAGKPEKLAADLAEVQDLCQEVVLGEHPMRLLDLGLDLIVKNPGIPYDIPFLAEARKRGISVVSEVELAYQHLPP